MGLVAGTGKLDLHLLDQQHPRSDQHCRYPDVPGDKAVAPPLVDVGSGQLTAAGSGDVAQVAVAKAFRHEGVARALISRMGERLEPRASALRLINVDAESEAALSFCSALGAEEFVRQYEMHRVI